MKLNQETPMTDDEKAIFAGDAETLFMFVLNSDIEGAHSWLHGLQHERVKTLNRNFGTKKKDMVADIGVFHELIIERSRSAILEAHLATSRITTEALIRPEWKKWSFWLGVVGTIAGIGNLLLRYFTK